MRERVVWMLIAMMIVDITIGMYGLFKMHKMQKAQEQTDRSQWAAMVQMHRQMVVEHKQTEDKPADLNKQSEPPPIVQPQIPDNAGIPDILPPPGPAPEVEQREEGCSFSAGLLILILAVIAAFVIGGEIEIG